MRKKGENKGEKIKRENTGRKYKEKIKENMKGRK